MACRIEVFLRNGQIIDLELENGQDRAFAAAVNDTWSSTHASFARLAIGEQAVVLANEVVGYRLHGSVLPDPRGL